MKKAKKGFLALVLLCALVAALCVPSSASDAVAAVDGVEYATFDAAWSAAEKTDAESVKITLLSDITLDKGYAWNMPGRNIEIDLANHTVSAGAMMVFGIVSDSCITVKNGNIKCEGVAFQSSGALCDVVLENLIINKSTADNTAAVNITSADSVTITDVEVNAQRCIVLSGDCRELVATRLISNATTSNALRIYTYKGTYNFIDCVFTSQGSGRTIESALSGANAAANTVATEGVHFQSTPISTDAVSDTVTYKVTGTDTAVFNLYGCTVKNYKSGDTFASMIIRPGVATFNLYGGYYYAGSATSFISNSFANYTQALAKVYFHKYEKDGVTYFPIVNIDPSSSKMAEAFYLQDFYDVEISYTVSGGEYSPFAVYSATAKSNAASVQVSSSNGDYKYVIVPHGESYTEAFATPLDPKSAVARIGATYYSSLAAAASAAREGDVVVLVANVSGESLNHPCFVNKGKYSLSLSDTSPYSVVNYGSIGADFANVGKSATATVNFWKNEDAAASQAESGLAYRVYVPITEGAVIDFSKGYCTLDLTYTDTEGNEHLHTGWREYSKSEGVYNYVPIFEIAPDIFEVIASDGSVISRGKTPEAFQSEMLKPTAAGETIRMLADIELQKINQAITAAGKPYTLDINGYTLSILSTQTVGAMYKTYQKIDLTITSSRPGGFINNIRGGSASAQMFWAASGSSGKLTINGENLKIDSGNVFGGSSTASFELDINGGEYVTSVGSNRALFALNSTGSCTITIDDAYIYCTHNRLFSFGSSASSPSKVYDVRVNNSLIDTGANTLLNTSDGTYFENSTLTFTNSYIATRINTIEGNTVNIGEGCMLFGMETAGAVLANPIHEIEPFTVRGYTFTYSTSSPSHLATVIWQSGNDKFVSYYDANAEDATFNKTVYKGGVRSVYSGEFTADFEKGKTYIVELEKLATVDVRDIKYNLTLASNMDVNIAIPKDAYNTVRATYLGRTLKGKYTIIDSKDYYVVSVKDMNAVSTTSPITISLEYDGATAQDITVTIADYAEALMKCGETKEAVELGRALLQYSYEAHKALAAEETETIAKLAAKLAGTSTPEDVSFTGESDEALARYFKGAHLRLKSTPGIVFTLSDELDSLECDISYTDANGILKSKHFSLTSEEREAVVGNIKVYELGSRITVTVEGEEPMTYSLESYLASGSISNSFAQAIHHYVEATGAYMEISRESFDITAFTVAGVSVEGAVIVADLSSVAATEAAYMLRATIYSSCGIYLDIENIDSTAERRIVICEVDDAGGDTFRARVVDGELYLECEYIDYFVKGMTKFIADELADECGELDFGTDYLYECDAYFVRYSEFGAMGDGVTNDYPAIIRTHFFANKNKMSVEADVGATYYISFVPDEAVIKTNTNWHDARFIIDDRAVTFDQKDYHIFRVDPDRESYAIDVPEGMAPMKTDTNVGLTFDGRVMLNVKNSGERVYIRSGAAGNAGAQKNDMLIVEANGDIDPNTPFVFDYKAVTSIVVYPIDDEPITISGGVLVTRSNQTNSNKFYARNIYITRSNVTLKGVEHYVTDEPTDLFGASCYAGFYSTSNAYNVTFDSCVMTGHRMYKEIQADGDILNKGNYDISLSSSLYVSFIDCTQSNDINNTTYWGVMGSGQCKNVTWEGCTLSRFDAHDGIHNVTIRNCTIGELINLVGSGTAYLENVTRTGTGHGYFIRLREDYGALWDGDIIIKDCTFTVNNNSSTAYVFRADWMAWNFGYDCQLPNLDIDGFKVVKKNGADFTGKTYIFKNFSSSYSGDLRENATNPLFAPKTIKLKGIAYYDILEGTNNDVVLSDTVITKED